jgi:hypothetical protein
VSCYELHARFGVVGDSIVGLLHYLRVEVFLSPFDGRESCCYAVGIKRRRIAHRD